MTMQLEMSLQDDAALGSQPQAVCTPAIRFKGFGGAWEIKNLGSLCPIGDIDHRMPQSTASGIPYLMTGDFFGINGLGFENAKLISNEDYEQLSKKIKPEAGDILFARYASVGAVRYVETDIKFLISYSCAILKTSNKSNGKYLFYFLQTGVTQHQIELGINTGSQRNIGIDSLKELSIGLPTDKEQTAIGNYFQQLDSLIAQHQHKHTKLLNLKQALLQKMFPKQGATVPEVRFQGFSGDWEEQKWRDSVDISREMVDPKNGLYDELFHIGPGNIESFTGKIYNNVLRVKDSNLISGKFYFKKGDIIYGKINPQLAKQIIAPFEGLASADAYILNAKNETAQSYLYVILQTGNFYKYSVSVSARTGMPKINREELDLYTYKAPKKLEQTAIGQLFQQLDHLITQQHALLTKLGNLKQAYLAKMFI